MNDPIPCTDPAVPDIKDKPDTHLAALHTGITYVTEPVNLQIQTTGSLVGLGFLLQKRKRK